MPLPLVFIGVIAATGAIGLGKSAKAAIDTKKAKKINEEATYAIAYGKYHLDKARKFSKNSLNQLGHCKLNILESSVMDFVNNFSLLKNVEFKETPGIEELNNFKIDKQELEELKELGGFATSIMGGIASGALGGAITAFGAYGAAGTLAAASTGTAIASLSGAAATNATLAFFGGGSLAAGGLGMAGGAMVLGGLVAGPALAIMGFIVGAKAATEKNKAYENLATAKKCAKEMEIASDMCYAIGERSNMFREVLEKLNNYLLKANVVMKEAISQHNADFNKFSNNQKKNVALAVSVVKTIKTILDTPILTSEGTLTISSEKILNETINSDLYKGRDIL